MAQGFSTGGNIVITGSVDSNNSTSTPLNNGASFTGTATDVSAYPSVVVACYTDQSGTLSAQFSVNGTNWDSALSFAVAANTNEVHRITVTRRYFRVVFTNNSGSNQTFLRLQSLKGGQFPLTSSLNSTIQTDADSIVTRSVLMGQTDSGQWKFVPTDTNGHLEVAIHSPRLPFGSVHTESLTPLFQVDGVYGVNLGMLKPTSSGSGSVDTVDSSLRVQTGTTVLSQGVLQTIKRLRYRPGQGVVARFTGKYDTPVASSYQLIGIGHAEDGVYFGYGNTNNLADTRFGILYVQRGSREVRTLTISTASSTTENVTVTLNGVANSVAVTNSGNIQRTVWELSIGTYTGWEAYPVGSTIVFVRNSSGTASAGAYTVAGTTIVGSFAQTKAGAASTDVFIPQEDWNGDPMDGTGASGVTLDPQKGNVFQIGLQYLGYGAVTFFIENAVAGNNADFIPVHTMLIPNTLTKTIFGNPSFPFTMAAYSAGSTTNLNLQSGSLAGFIEGHKMLQGGRFSYFNFVTTGNASTLVPLFTVMNQLYYGGRVNQAVINLLSVSGAVKHTQPVIYYLIRNGSLTGNPNFTALSSTSVSVWDTAATGVTYSNNNQLIWTGHLGETGEIDHHFSNGEFNAEEITIQPGEWVTLAVKSVANNIAYATGALNTREDQ